jgi:hypothetical protein
VIFLILVEIDISTYLSAIFTIIPPIILGSIYNENFKGFENFYNDLPTLKLLKIVHVLWKTRDILESQAP